MTSVGETFLSLRLTASLGGRRLDQALVEMFPQFSRSRLQHWIDAGKVKVDGRACRRRDRVWGGEQISLESPSEPDQTCLPQDLPLAIVFEDEDLLVINKPAGLVVHPAVGNPDGTLQNALLHHAPELAELPRAGLVHRLDKDTSGLMVVARTPAAHASLVRQLLVRSVSREYLAICVGVMTGGGSIDKPIGRHRTDRVRMAIREDGRPARTHYRVLERFRGHTLLRVKLETGRTHQIRLHLSHLGQPIVGDPVYGRRLSVPRGATDLLRQQLHGFHRQALHAAQLAFDHPRTGERLKFERPPPADMQALLAALRDDLKAMRPT